MSASDSVLPVPAFRPSLLWGMALGGAIASGLVAWGVGEFTQGHFVGRLSKIVIMGGTMDGVTLEDSVIRDEKNATLTYGMMGAVLGFGFGLAGGLVRKSPRLAMNAGLAGLAIGGVVGFGVTKGLLMIYFGRKLTAEGNFSHDMVLPFLIHAGIWSSIAAVAGGAFGLGLGVRGSKLASAALGGLAGGLLASVVYEVVGGIAFPLANTNQPIAGFWPPRLLAMLLVSILAALLAAFAIAAPGRRPSKVAAPGTITPE
jgi:hypothetical protein